jgi:hypothetical protein
MTHDPTPKVLMRPSWLIYNWQYLFHVTYQLIHFSMTK